MFTRVEVHIDANTAIGPNATLTGIEFVNGLDLNQTVMLYLGYTPAETLDGITRMEEGLSRLRSRIQGTAWDPIDHNRREGR